MGQKPWAGLFRAGAVGDALITASVFPLLAEKYQVEAICEAPWGDVWRENPHIAKLTILPKGTLPEGNMEQWQAWFTKRAKEYDAFWNLSHSCEGLLALFPAQTSFHWPAEYRRRLCNHSYVEVVHDICGVRHRFAPVFFPTEAETAKAIRTKEASAGKRAIGWVLSGSRVDKKHPYSPLIIARLIRELGIPVMVFGNRDNDHNLAREAQDAVKCHNGTDDGFYSCVSPFESETWEPTEIGKPGKIVKPGEPRWPLRRSLSQLQQCDLVITPDTGPAWAVAWEPMPKIVLLSHASPKNITAHWRNTTTLHADAERVPCWPCHKLHDSLDTCVPNAHGTGAACITDIDTETIVAAAKRLLQEGK